MKQKKLMHDLHAALKIILRFSKQHLATLNMIEGMYIRQPLHHERVVGLEATITIKSCGSIYQVTRADYISDTPECENTWLATYGWHSSGHLMEIGGDRYCIFDAASGFMYLESLTDRAETTLELFVKNS